MSNSVVICGKERKLRHWPARPGFRFAREIGKVMLELFGGLSLADIEHKSESEMLDLLKGIDLAAILSDERIGIALEMVVHGLEFDDHAAAQKDVESASLQEVFAALKAVVGHNMVFLQDHLGALIKSKGTSTKRASKPRA